MNRHVLPLIIGSLLLPLGCGGDDPAGPTFDPLVIGAVTLPPAVPTVAYSVTLSATGGDGSYTWSVSSGSTPGGLTLSTNGEISGTPTGSSSTFTVQVASADGQTASQELAIDVNDVLTVMTASLPTGFANTTYDETLVALGGAGSYTWSLAVGALPTGLSLNASTGSISGTPTMAETQNFTVEVASGDGQTTGQALSIEIENETEEVVIVGVEAWPAGRTRAGNLPDAAIDGDINTFTWTTEAFNPHDVNHIAFDLGASTTIKRIRLWKTPNCGSSGSPNLVCYKNLIVQYSTDSGDLSTRTWNNVTGLNNGWVGDEMLDASAVNADGSIELDRHDSTTDGWASLGFDEVAATAIRISIEETTEPQVYPFNHYKLHEIEIHRAVMTP